MSKDIFIKNENSFPQKSPPPLWELGRIPKKTLIFRGKSMTLRGKMTIF